MDEKVEVFTSLPARVDDVHASVRPIRMKRLPAPWLTDDNKAVREMKNRAKSRYKYDPSDKNHNR